ncbi:MAG TPA: condensation domain-containing protein, partial [Symbiobacteriaceae bacterium]|nr:condensation domain-containing protein [Symbiobacteriaceae bacterium]
ISRHDDFFMLGGHSLLATQLLSRVGRQLTLAEFFAAPTVAELAALLERGTTAEQPIVAVPRVGPERLSFAQERLAYFDELEPGSPLYNVAEAIRLTGPVETGALETAINLVVARHEILRTNFVGGRQVIHPVRRIALAEVDTGGGPVEPLVQAEARRPFDLAHDALLRATLVRLGPEEHLLLLTFHHIVIDGWSIGVFYRDLGAAYAGRELPPVALQYADVARWQRSWLQGRVEAEQLAYWQKELAGVPTALELPTDRPRPAVQSFAGARRVRALPGSLVADLQALSRREGATLFMTLMAAYQTLLCRYAGQEQFLVGAPVANRNRAELEAVIGFFVNTLALPADFRGNPTFREVLRRVRRAALGAFAHQDLPFERVVDALQPVRDPSRPALVQTMFALQNAPMGALQLPGITVRNTDPTGLDTGTAKADLIVTVEEAEGEFRVLAEYATALYDAATVDRLLGHFETLLQATVASPDQPVSHLPLLTAAEVQQILVDWNATEQPYPTDRSVVEMVAAQPPDCLAVAMGERRLTYGELNRLAGNLAQRLAALGVGPEVRVGVCLERSPELPAALLAVWQAGGAYVAMDPAYPDDRLQFMLQDAGAPVVVTQRTLAGRFGGTGVPVLCVEDHLVGDESVPVPSVSIRTDNLAYVIYTSGSTGTPKGVAIEHGGLLNLIFWHRLTYGLTAADRTTQMAGPGFDASVWEIWPALTAGAALLMPDEETRLAPQLLQQWLLANEVTIAFLPTPLAEAVLALPWPAEHSLAVMLTGGDRLHQYPDRDPGFVLVNHYGPTEATVVATAGRVPVRPKAGGG